MCLCEHILHMEGRGQSVRVSFLNLLCGFWDSKPGPQVWPQGHTSSPNLVFILLQQWLILLVLQMHIGISASESEVSKYTVHLRICPGQRRFLFAKQQAVEGFLLNGPFALLKRISFGKL